MKNIIFAAVLFTFLLCPRIFSQSQIDALKKDAEKEMSAGKYGEAIALLNRYISARPQEAQGYNLRGLCYQKQADYEMAVYDFRSARKIKSDDPEINNNLAVTSDAFNKILYNNIEGHKREIALYPQRPLNYLEIGKCYKNLGQWLIAEDWYDKYLKLEEASPDEIIRYTEILAKNNHIQKGEPILKSYTIKFPTDQRLWSRFGYFELWLGKNKNAIYAFVKALELKPYFKEAINGLDQAKGKGYIYTVNDTSYRYGRSLGSKSREYPIDRYYRLLKKNPNDNEVRFTLIDELLKHKRFQEAHDLLIDMRPDSQTANTDRFKLKFESVNSILDSIYNYNVKTYPDEFQKNNHDRNLAIKLSDSYAHLYDYDNAIIILEKYLATVKENEDLDLRFMLAKYAGWSYQWNTAFNQMAILLKYDPANLKYKLFSAQLVGWNITDAKPDEVERAKGFILDVLKDDPKNLSALLAMCYLTGGKGNITEAQKYLTMAKSVSPHSKEVEALDNSINTWILVKKEKEILSMREEAGKLYDAGKYQEAADKYDEIIAKLDKPEKNILLEYAAYNSKAGRYDIAIKTYDNILLMGPDFDVSLLRAENYLSAGDTTRALQEFSALKTERPYDFPVNYNLGNIYEKMKKNDEAINLYQSVLDANTKNKVSLDSSQISVYQTRLGYLRTGNQYSTSLFGYVSLAPLASFYTDNQNFTFSDYGGRFETGIAPYISVGASLFRYRLKYFSNSDNLTSFLGHIIFNITDFNASAGFGKTRSSLNSRNDVLQFTANYEKKNNYGLGFLYEKNDARVLLYSPFLLNTNLNAGLFRFTGNYISPNEFILTGHFSYINISEDHNAGQDLQLRAGKLVEDRFQIGYEFYYVNYTRNSNLYYSPGDFQSHSIWGDWKVYKDPEISLNLGGKIGYVPSYDFILREIYGEVIYQPVPVLIISGRISNSSSIRFDSGYNFWAGYITGYLSIF
jgi:tetratricopeptide (TPR) repeat protein